MPPEGLCAIGEWFKTDSLLTHFSWVPRKYGRDFSCVILAKATPLDGCLRLCRFAVL